MIPLRARGRHRPPRVKRRGRAVGWLVVASVWAAWWPAVADPVRIGVVFDGEATTTTQLLEQVKQETLTLTEGEFDVRFDPADVATGDWTERSIEVAIETLLKDPEVDLVLALGTVASHGFCCRGELTKPVIAAIVIDPALQDLPSEGGASGVHNLNYLAFPRSFERDVELFREIVPFDKLTIVLNRWFMKVVPEIGDQVRELVADQGLEADLVAAGDTAEEILAAIGDDAEAVYAAPLLHLTDAERGRFIEGLEARRLPSFSIFGAAEVAQGMLAGQRDSAFYSRLARRIALNVQRILLGEDAGTLPVTIPDRRRLVINMATARAIGAFPPWHLLTEAELLNEEIESLPLLTIREAVEQTVDANLDLAASERGLAAVAERVRQARSALLPRLEAGLRGVRIDRERAGQAFSVQAERTWTGDLTLTQLIYSDPARANVRVATEARLGREQELELLRLDLVEGAMAAYMSVLLAETVEKILKSNLEVSRSNLELAEVRRAVGAAGPGEVYRWQSEVATARRDLVDARADTYRSRVALNRLRHRPLEEGFRTEDFAVDEVLALSDPEQFAEDRAIFQSGGRLIAFTGTPLHFEAFRQLMVDEGLERAPELARLDAAIAAQERILQSARRAFWSPEVALSGQLDQVLDDGGEVSDLVAGMEETRWSLALSATLPLFTGGRRRAEAAEAEATLAELELERRAVAERLEERIRSRLYLTNASFSGIRLTRQAAAAARQNLELVTDSYSRGVVDVLDLLDAQNAALSADLAAASALYQFFSDLIAVERAVNWFEVERSPADRAAFFSRLETAFRERGLEPRRSLAPFGDTEE